MPNIDRDTVDPDFTLLWIERFQSKESEYSHANAFSGCVWIGWFGAAAGLFVGTWKMNAAKSKAESQAIKSVTFEIEVFDNG